MTTITLIASLLSLLLTFFVLWSNPQRFSNQVFAIAMLLETAWLACVYRAMQIGGMGAMTDTTEALEWWFRANAMIIAFLPATMWLLTSSITSAPFNRHRVLYNTIPILLLCILSSSLCLTPSFVSRDASGLLQRGLPYYIFAVIGLSLYVGCVVRIIRAMRVHTGIRRVELQFLALNAGGAAFLLLGLNAFGNLTNNRVFNRVSVFLVLITTAITACALLFHRVFNVKEMFFQLAHRVCFSCILSGGIYSAWHATRHIITEPFGLLLSIAVLSPIAVWLDRQSRAWFDIAGESKLADLRRSVIEIGLTEVNTAPLVQRFKHLFCTRFQTDGTYFLDDRGTRYEDGVVSLSKDRPAYHGIVEIGWATPEALERRRRNPKLVDLAAFLNANTLGAIVSIPRGSAKPSAFVALRTRADEVPYTFAEIERIQTLADLIDSTITRSQLTAQASLRTRMQYLGMMSRGLAHDLKNLITPVSEYLNYSNNKHEHGTNEHYVHQMAQRSMRSVAEYIQESLAFSKCLEPRFELVSVVDLCKNVIDAAWARALRRNVKLFSDCSISTTINVDGILVERMLLNIIHNAIDASSPHQTVSLSAHFKREDRVIFQICDNGTGILPHNMTRIFDPYFTTKTLEGADRGIGLGLTIASNIVFLHDGYITAKSEPGCQTVISVELPLERAAPQVTNSLNHL